MLLRIALFLVLLPLALIAQAPAWLADSALEHATDGAIRLTAIEGSLWNGQGALVAIDPQSRRALPWTTLSWRWRPQRLLQAETAWTLTADNRPAGEIGIGPHGWRADGLSFAAPARFLLERIPNTFAHLGWRGDLRLESQQWRCTWEFHCNGHFDLRWTNASVDVLRNRTLGDYQLTTQGETGRLHFALTTLTGDARLQGEGHWEPSGVWHFSGTIEGDPSLMQRLPAVANQWVQPSGKPGAYRFELGG